MTAWDWSVKIDSVEFGNVLNSIEVTRGAGEQLDQSSPAFASVELLGLPAGQTGDWYVGKLIEIRVRPNVVGGAWARLLYGQVVRQATRPVDSAGNVIVTELQCQSYMARLQQITVGNEALTAQTEYERIYGFLDRQTYPTWADQPDTLTWASIPTLYNKDITWAQWDFTDAYFMPLLIVPNWEPGDPDPSLDLEAAAPNTTTNMLDEAMNMAMGCGGWIYESDGGLQPQIHYLSRADIGSAPDRTVDISDKARVTAIDDISAIWDIYTEAVVSNSTISRSDVNFDAMKQYGIRTLELTSPLANAADLQTVATTKVTALSRPLPNLSRITVDYALLTAAERLWDAGRVYTLSGIPDAFGGTQRYQIRGLTFRGSTERLEVDWTLLPLRSLFPGPMWRDVGAATTWSALTTTWENWI